MSELQRKSSQQAIDRARAWALAHPERRREIARKSYLKHRPLLKPVYTPIERLQRNSMPVPESGCWLWLKTSDRNGYGKAKYQRKDIRAHRLSWILHRGPIPDGLSILHHCDVPTCINPDHLFLGTIKDNVDDMWKKGRRGPMRGGRTPKLTDEQVLQIRSLKGKFSQVVLAEQFGIDSSQISRIQTGKYWKHLMGTGG